MSADGSPSHPEPAAPAPSAAAPDPADIGHRLAAHRIRHGMRVSELAREVGVSPSLVSQIERGQSRPSVSTLFAFAQALDVPVDAFFRDQPESDDAGAHDDAAAPGRPDATADARASRYVVRRGERATIAIEGGVRWERLTPTQLQHVEFMELVYEPGAESNPVLYRHPGVEMVLVLAGVLTLFVGFERYQLREGDSICFPSTTPHRYVNEADKLMRAVTVILPDEAGV